MRRSSSALWSFSPPRALPNRPGPGRVGARCFAALLRPGPGRVGVRCFAFTKRVLPQDAAQRAVTITIVGRPNVGKSALFNRLLSGTLTREWRAIEYGRAGTTRDRKEALGIFGSRVVRLVDTGGLEDESATARDYVCSNLELERIF